MNNYNSVVIYDLVKSKRNSVKSTYMLKMYDCLKKNNYKVYYNTKSEFVENSIGIILGYKTNTSIERNKVIDYYSQNKQILYHLDSNCFSFCENNGEENLTYRRFISNSNLDYTQFDYKFEELLKFYKLSHPNIGPKGNNILFCLQASRGWSMNGVDHIKYFDTTLQKIREFTDKPIIIRFHPRDLKKNRYKAFLNKPLPDNVHISNNKSIIDDLKNAHTTLFYNSSIGFVSLINGVPIISLDHSDLNYYKNYTNSLDNIENLNDINYLPLLKKISSLHFNYSDFDNLNILKKLFF